MNLAITISGSFQKALNEIRDDIVSFEALGCQVLSPRMFTRYTNEDGFVVLDSDGGRRPAAIHGRHLASIDRSVLLWVRNPQGYVGLSTALEIGHAHAIGIPIFASDHAKDASLNRYLTIVSSPKEALEAATGNSQANHMPPGRPDSSTQDLVAFMSAECGFEEETDHEILKLLDGEISELKEAVEAERFDSRQRHGVAEELADCAIYLYHFANQSGINLARAIADKIQINLGRWGRKSGTA